MKKVLKYLIIKVNNFLGKNKKTKSSKNIAKHAIKHYKNGNVDKAFSIIVRGLMSWPKSLHLKDTFASIGREVGLEEEALGAVRSAVSLRQQRKIKILKDIDFYPKTLEVEDRIFLSGYFYSGSGAVLDYLLGFKECYKWPAIKGEMRLIKFPGGLADLGNRLEKNNSLNAADLVDLYLHLTGNKIVHSAKTKYDPWRVVNKNSSKILKDNNSHAYLFSAFQLFWHLHSFMLQDTQTIEEFEKISISGVKQMLNGVAGQLKANKLLVDQIITAWRLPIARFAPPSSIIIVHRDPRDQYAEAYDVRVKSGRTAWTAHEFTKIYKERRMLVSENIPILEKKYGHRFLTLSFEDFVLKHDIEVKKVLDFLQISPEDITKQYFSPEVSSKNVGKYKSMLSEKDRKIIESSIPEYLYQ